LAGHHLTTVGFDFEHDHPIQILNILAANLQTIDWNGGGKFVAVLI
jgi:hypothetical protein